MTGRGKPREVAPEGSPTLEGRLGRLEEIMSQLESDEVALEKALELFEEGVRLVREAERILSETELRVDELLTGGKTAPFHEEPGVRESFDLEDYLAAETRPVQDALERAVARIGSYVDADVAAAIGHGVLSGGKRLRPILCVTAYTACGGRRMGAAYDLAAAIELIHAYSLMHDDLPCMDDADLRRGRPTTHKVHGEDVTLRAGAALIPAAALQAWSAAEALGCAPAVARQVALALLEAAGGGGMVGGQWLDLEAEGRVLGSEELDRLHGRKTGAVLAASLLTGAVAAGASDDVLRTLGRYGRAVGLAFQIVDDILDATESAETLGKNPSDAALAKSTYVALHGLTEARRRASRMVREAIAELDRSGLEAPALAALARYVVARRR